MGRLSCNFFVGFRINEPSTIQGIAELQQRIVERVPDAAPCMLDHRLLHVTLCMIRLPDQCAIDRARDILREQILKVAVPVFSADPPVFDVKGLGFFRSNDLLYAQIDPTSHHAQNMAKVAESMYNDFNAAGFTPAPFKLPYTPHVTIWKSSKDNGHISRTDKQHGRRGYLQDAVYNDVVMNEADAMAGHFGFERPVTVELLKSWEKDIDGYYMVYDSVSLLGVPTPSNVPDVVEVATGMAHSRARATPAGSTDHF